MTIHGSLPSGSCTAEALLLNDKARESFSEQGDAIFRRQIAWSDLLAYCAASYTAVPAAGHEAS
jgi:hypothetical protein